MGYTYRNHTRKNYRNSKSFGGIIGLPISIILLLLQLLTYIFITVAQFAWKYIKKAYYKIRYRG